MNGYISAGRDVISLLSKFFMMVGLTFFTTTVSAQTAKVDLQKEVNIPAADMHLDELLNLLGKQAGTRFSVNTRKFPGSTMVHVQKGRQSLSRVLEDLRETTGMGYRALESHIIFVDAPAPVATKRTPAAVKQVKVTAPIRFVNIPISPLFTRQAAAPPINMADTNRSLQINTFPVLSIEKEDTVHLISLTGLSLKSASSTMGAEKEDTGHLMLLTASSLKKTSSTTGTGQEDTNHLTLLTASSLKKTSSTTGTGQEDTSRLTLLTVPSLKNASSTLGDTAYVKSRLITRDSIIGSSKEFHFGLRIASDVKDTAATKKATASHPRKSFAADLLERLHSTGGYTPVAGGTKNKGPLFAFKPYAAGGMVADESFYVNPTIQAGLPFLYVIGSWSTNFSFSMLRYGVGTSLRLSGNWRLHLQGTTGTIEASGYDSLGFIPIMVKAQLHKLSLVAEKGIGNHWRLQFGAALNSLQTTYYRMGKQSPLNKEENDALSDIKYFKPPYTISNNFSPDASRSNKLWIGFQAGIFYRFNFYKE